MFEARTHIANVMDNLQLIADLGCCVTSVCTPTAEGFQIRMAAQPATASLLAPLRMVGNLIDEQDAEIVACFETGLIKKGSRVQRGENGLCFVSHAYPIGGQTPYAVIVRDMPVGLSDTFGAMEEAFVCAATSLIEYLSGDILRLEGTEDPFSTSRVPGDGILILTQDGSCVYSSPNLAGILRRCGAFPSGETIREILANASDIAEGILHALTHKRCLEGDIRIGECVYSRRFLPFAQGGILLVEDVTVGRAAQRELRVKETIIREVHHRVKNNLQSIESLLRIQIRRSDNLQVISALTEATTRIEAMAVVHEMLASATGEAVDVSRMALMVSERVRRSMIGVYGGSFSIEVRGKGGYMDAHGASSLAIALTETIQNAIEHGFSRVEEGKIQVAIARSDKKLTMTISDDGCGLPEGFSLEHPSSMGLMLIKTMIEEDLEGSIKGYTLSSGGACFEIEVPIAAEKSEEK